MTKMNVIVYMKPTLHYVIMLRIVSIEKLTSKIILAIITANNHTLDTGRKLNVHKKFSIHPGRLLKVLCTFNLCCVSRGRAFRDITK